MWRLGAGKFGNIAPLNFVVKKVNLLVAVCKNVDSGINTTIKVDIQYYYILRPAILLFLSGGCRLRLSFIGAAVVAHVDE